MFLHRAIDRFAAFGADGVGNLADPFGLIGFDCGERLARAVLQRGDRAAQFVLRFSRQRAALLAERGHSGAQPFDRIGLRRRGLAEARLEIFDFAHRIAAAFARRCHAVCDAIPGAARFVEQRLDRFGPAFDRDQALFRRHHRGGQIVAAVLRAGLDQFEQADARIGERGHRHIGPVERFAAFGELFRKARDRNGDKIAGLTALRRGRIDLARECREAVFDLRGSLAQCFEMRDMPFAMRGECGIERGEAGFHPFGRLDLRGFERVAPFAERGFERTVALVQLLVDRDRLVAQQSQLGVGRVGRAPVELGNLRDGVFEPGLQRLDLAAPMRERGIFRLTQIGGDPGRIGA